MNTPGLQGWLYLAYLLVLLPLGAFRTSRRVREAGAMPPRGRILGGTLVALAVTFAVSWQVGRGWDYRPFAVPALGPRELGTGAGTLVLLLALRSLSRLLRGEEDIGRARVRSLAPRGSGDWPLFALVAVAAGVAEETAYRGVAHSLLWWMLGSPWIPTLLCAAAFALAHALQGWKAMLTIFVHALLMHALVWLTGGLVVAMAVHAVYDLIVGALVSRELAYSSPSAATPSSSSPSA